ncbi:NUDIX hydrolase [Clostridium sp. MB05]
MDITFKTEVGRFNYRVAGILIHDNKLLIMKDDNSPYYYIPGGRVRMHETSESAIIREIKEEVKIETKVNRLLWVVENLFIEEQSGDRFHEIGLYYLLDIKDESIFKKGNEFITNENGQHNLMFTWVELEKIKDLYIYPLFLKEKIMNLPNCVEHIIETKE